MSRGCGEDDSTTTADKVLLVAFVVILTMLATSVAIKVNKDADVGPPAQAEKTERPAASP